MSQGIQNRIGNYMHADGAVRRRRIGKRDYIIGIAGAYNAFGLIGPEHNGLFILDDTKKRVVLDRHAESPQGGYFGPSREQWAELERVMKMEPEHFKTFCANHPRAR
jgi:hypothetical protein